MENQPKKPEFPKPRIIREGFIPERNIMKGYRIKKVTKGHITRFIPQSQFLWIFWLDMFSWPKEVFPDDLGGFGSYEEALNALYSALPSNELEEKVKVEYLDVPYENREPNPPPRNP